MKRLLALAAVLAGTMAAAMPATAVSSTAEPGRMVLIGAGLLLTASIARQRTRSRE